MMMALGWPPENYLRKSLFDNLLGISLLYKGPSVSSFSAHFSHWLIYFYDLLKYVASVLFQPRCTQPVLPDPKFLKRPKNYILLFINTSKIFSFGTLILLAIEENFCAFLFITIISST